MEKYALGIDFGTTFSCVGASKDGNVIIIPNGINERTTPSVVIFDNSNKIYIGEETLNKVWNEDAIKIYEIKRLIGRKYSEVQSLIKYLSYKDHIIKGSNDEILINIFHKKYKPEDIVYLIINKLILNAKAYLGQDITDVIITVPADFGFNQRNSIKTAAEMIPGIKVKKILGEPSAAVLSYGFPKKFLAKENINMLTQGKIEHFHQGKILHPMEDIPEEFLIKENYIMNNEIVTLNEKVNSFKSQVFTKNIIVFDLGGGTYDVSLIEFNKNIFEIKSSAGDPRLGGGDFDHKIMEFCLKNFCHTNDGEKFIVEEIMKNTKSMQRLKIACENTKKFLSQKTEDSIFIEDFYNGESLNCKITRAQFEYICRKLFERLIPPLDTILNESKITSDKIDEIILVGGSSRIPKVKDILLKKFPNVIINDSINPEEAVAYGATIFCESERKKEGEFWDGFEYTDLIQHSYGIEIDEGKMEILLKRGDRYPTSNEKYFFTFYDNQDNFLIKVYEGENEFVKDNIFLREFKVSGFPRKKKGEICLCVNFKVDINQILNVRCYIKEFDIRKEIKIEMKEKYKGISCFSLGNISKKSKELIDQEMKIKNEIYVYSLEFKNAKDNKKKLELITKFNDIIISYLNFYFEKLKDFESEKFLTYGETLFKSYAYVCNNTELLSIWKESINMEKNIRIYFRKIYKKNPFKLKSYLSIFKPIDIKKSTIFYNASIIAMEFLYKLGDIYFSFPGKNCLNISKDIFEECFFIANDNFCLKNKEKSENIFSLINPELKTKFQMIHDNCEKKINLISAISFIGIENTKQSGQLFSNNENLNKDDLSLLSYNFFNALKKMQNVNIIDNKEKIEAESICYANIVKIELIKDKNKINSKKLLDYAEKSINKAAFLEKEILV